ncbi:helix-turn-helix transcriptional regulator [Endozoicomonas sp. SM1973]|uniref:Helix-turn-helix transcriptional regulator n=1 Tax=Spartinivicinus marinus TaxID=2994442 RepID=A0A853IGH2_9GAMM|nr:helix-turn-helix transcriptional regulator [Spartinivicinus marinus]NYZ68577.1 helix-turn-helix transcriptional regulator [Spartinivicinus marinus]
MPIECRIQLLLAQKKIKSKDLAEKIGITPQNLSVLANGRAKGIRFSTLEALCEALECTPGDILQYEKPEDEK